MSVSICARQDYETEVPVLVVGAGATGLCAALAAKPNADVLVLEADPRPYGSTGMSYGGICAAGSALQSAAGIDDSPESLLKDILTAAKNQTNPDLARLLAFESAPAMDWLTGECEIELTIEKSWSGLGHSQPRMHAPVSRSGEDLINMLSNACSNNDIDILCDARVVEIFADQNQFVHGVRLERPDGSSESIGCGALVLATCGFGGNAEMVTRHIPEIASAAYFGHEGNKGDGINWGVALGGVANDMGSYQALGSLAYPQNLVIPHTLMIGGGIQVNLDGERFEDELANISGQALDILKQPQGLCWIVYDERLHQHAAETFADYRTAIEIKACKTASNLKDLASQLKIPIDALEKSVEQIEKHKTENASCEFGREFSPEQKLQPPYYGIKVGAALFHTQGGLEINADARVVREDGQPLPNLFAGGGAARSVSGPGIWGYLPAMGLCTAVTLGKIAGTAAAKLTGGSI